MPGYSTSGKIRTSYARLRDFRPVYARLGNVGKVSSG
jgi:hypothetical protein